MSTIFLVCFAIGGTVLVCQLVLTLLGLGGDMFHVDVPHDVGHGVGGDVPHDIGGDVGHALGGDLHGADHASHAPTPTHEDATQAFRVLSFRTVVAALTFFGLGGLVAESAEAAPVTVFVAAAGAGAAAMYGVYWLLRGLYSLRSEGTLQIHRAVGKQGTVYLPIPGQRAGAGKIQVSVQNRLVEYLAMTAGDPLPSGAKVTVVGIVTPNTVQVEPVMQLERSVE